MRERVEKADNPRNFWKPLQEDKVGLWRYRVRDYRIICRIDDFNLVVPVVQVGHGITIYDE